MPSTAAFDSPEQAQQSSDQQQLPDDLTSSCAKDVDASVCVPPPAVDDASDAFPYALVYSPLKRRLYLGLATLGEALAAGLLSV